MPAKRHKLSSSAVCLQSFLVDNFYSGVFSVFTPLEFQRGMFAITACGQVVTLGSPASPPLEFQRGVFAIIACGQVVAPGSPVSPPLEFQRGMQSLLVDKLSPWGLQRPHSWSSSMACLQSLLVDRLSPCGL